MAGWGHRLSEKDFTSCIPLPHQGYLCGPCPLGLGQLRCPQWHTGSLGVWCPWGPSYLFPLCPASSQGSCLPLLPMQIWFSIRSQDLKTGKKQEVLCLSLKFHSLIQYLPGSPVLPLCVCVCVQEREKGEREEMEWRWAVCSTFCEWYINIFFLLFCMLISLQRKKENYYRE